MNKTRIVYFDYLRILAALAVVMLHTAASQYSLIGAYHYAACFWDGIARWGVPIFVMISGALFLEPSKTITIKKSLINIFFVLPFCLLYGLCFILVYVVLHKIISVLIL